jgi:hypothetical protein
LTNRKPTKKPRREFWIAWYQPPDDFCAEVIFDRSQLKHHIAETRTPQEIIHVVEVLPTRRKQAK